MAFRVGTAEVHVVPKFTGFKQAVEGETRGVGRSANASFSREMDGDKAGRKFGGGFASAAGKAMGALAVLGLGQKMASVASEGVALASDLEESGSKVNQIFGVEGAKALDKFASAGAKALGQTKLDVLEAAGTFGVFGKSAGMTGTKLAGFSTQMVQLSTDLASFHNTSPEEAVQALGAALRGETEPMRRYGVLLDDASMRQEAMRQGLIKNTKTALTPQQKVLAAQALIMKQTKDAQGDFAKTSGGLANQQRILSAQWSEMKAKLGSALLPVLTKVVGFLNRSMVPAFGFLQRTLAPVGTAIQGAFSGDGVSGFMARLQPLIQWLQASFLPAFMDVFATFRVYWQQAATIVGQFVTGMWTRLQPMLPQVRAVFSQVGAIIVGALGLVQAIVQRATQAIGYIWSRWGSQIMSVAAWAFGRLLTVIQPALALVRGVISAATNAIHGNWSGAWQNIKSVFANAWRIIVAQAQTMGTLLKAAVAKGVDLAVAAAKRLPNLMTGALAKLGQIGLDAGKAIMEKLAKGISDKMSAPVQKIKDATARLRKFLPNSPAAEGPFSGSGWGGWGESITGEWAKGLDRGVPRLAAAAARTARAAYPVDAVPSRATGSQVAPVGGAARAAISVVNNITQPSDPWVISEQIGRSTELALAQAS